MTTMDSSSKRQKKADNGNDGEDKPVVISIKYWPLLARASGLFRMCAEAGVAYQHISGAQEIGAALFGAQTTNLAPPIIEDHQKKIVLSQAAPCHQYLGEKFGFDKNIAVPQLALQYIGDLADLHSDMEAKASAGKASNDVEALQEYLTGERYKKHLQAIERSIQGPFYFGNEPTYVDFAVVSYLDMCEGKWLNPLLSKSGDTLKQHAPKLKAIAKAIRELPSAQNDKIIARLPMVPSFAILQPNRVGTWKE